MDGRTVNLEAPQDSPQADLAPATFNGSDFRSALGTFATGVTVITTKGEGDPYGMTANASLVVQQLAAVSTEPVLVEPGPALVEAAEDAGVLVVGLSERWREEGLGPVRSEIAKRAPAPVLFVRRGRRPGALAPPDNMTRFRWSSADRPMVSR